MNWQRNSWRTIENSMENTEITEAKEEKKEATLASLCELKTGIAQLKKEIEKTKRRMERLEDSLTEKEDSVLENKLKKERANKKKLTAELKASEEKYDVLLEEVTAIFMKDMTKQKAFNMASDYGGMLSNRLARKFSRFYTFYSNRYWPEDPNCDSIHYYFCRLYIALRLIESRKNIMKYIKITDQGTVQCGCLADIVESELTSQDTAYIHRQFVKRKK